MAINYTKIGWDTSKYVNPSNMNQMDDGIKAACDGVDGISANYIKATQSAAQTLTTTNSARTALILKSGTTTGTFVNFRGSNDAVYGYLGVTSSNKPCFLDASATEHEIALVEKTMARPTIYSIASGASQTITLASNAIYLLMNTSNVSKIMRLIATSGYGFSINDLMTLQGFTITSSGLNTTIQNTTSYALTVQLLVVG